MQRSYDGYLASSGSRDYYTALVKSPCPPNPSVGTIKADQGRIRFDLEVLQKKEDERLKLQFEGNTDMQNAL